MKTVLVTGCAGLIGSHLSEYLLNRGDRVIGVDEMNKYYSLKQKEENLNMLKSFENFSFFKLDICEFDELLEICKSCEVNYIAHLAARAGVRASIENPFIYEHSNSQGTLSVLEVARELNIENSVITSSSSVYGDRESVPFSESDCVDFPISPYAATKKACELMSYTYHHLYGLNINVIRPFTIYGPRGRPDMAPYLFMSKILNGEEITKYGSGDTYRDYTYIDDFVDGFVSALDSPLGYEIFNLGNNSPISLNEFISTIEEVCGRRAIVREIGMQQGDVSKTYANISKAQRLLGYSPRVSLREGMEEMRRWFEEMK
ncbi:MAG: GDP-mannose 4,6-dehydratase [Candidatus Nanoarchaeia archaeon]